MFLFLIPRVMDKCVNIVLLFLLQDCNSPIIFTWLFPLLVPQVELEWVSTMTLWQHFLFHTLRVSGLFLFSLLTIEKILTVLQFGIFGFRSLSCLYFLCLSLSLLTLTCKSLNIVERSLIIARASTAYTDFLLLRVSFTLCPLAFIVSSLLFSCSYSSIAGVFVIV